jgi:hypothetical protein
MKKLKIGEIRDTWHSQGPWGTQRDDVYQAILEAPMLFIHGLDGDYFVLTAHRAGPLFESTTVEIVSQAEDDPKLGPLVKSGGYLLIPLEA